MWTSDRAAPPRRRDGSRFQPILEAIGLSLLFALLPEILLRNEGRILEPHPFWIAILVLSARYGIEGFVSGMGAAFAGAALGSMIASSEASLLPAGIDSPSNLVFLAACMIVSWVGSLHCNRENKLREEIREAEKRRVYAEETSAAVSEVVAALRTRADCTSSSLTFLRDVATRLEGDNPTAAAEAAADLALIRSGASAVAVKVKMGEDGNQKLWALRTPGSGSDVDEYHLLPLSHRCVPIQSGNRPVGTLELWGIPENALTDQTTHDLSVIASWCGKALSSLARQAQESPFPKLGSP
jgi:hypothetical protein